MTCRSFFQKQRLKFISKSVFHVVFKFYQVWMWHYSFLKKRKKKFSIYFVHLKKNNSLMRPQMKNYFAWVKKLYLKFWIVHYFGHFFPTYFIIHSQKIKIREHVINIAPRFYRISKNLISYSTKAYNSEFRLNFMFIYRVSLLKL